MYFTFEQVRHAAQGRWRDLIFPAFGIQVHSKTGKHSACPVCGGKDRFRCDDKNGHGSFICTNCGAGDGFKLVQLARGFNAKESLKEIAAILGLHAESSITDADRQKWREDYQTKQLKEQQQKLEAQKLVQAQATQQWQSIQDSTTNISPYLQRKQVDNFGCKIKNNGNLVIPLCDIDGNLWNLQEIHPNGFKTFIKNGRVNGCYHVLGSLENQKYICIAEGYATAASIYMATGLTTVVTLNTSNLPKVAAILFKKFPTSCFVYCADDDSLSNPPNAGLKAAQKAHAVTGGIIILPKGG